MLGTVERRFIIYIVVLTGATALLAFAAPQFLQLFDKLSAKI